jgi:selenobiotic family peptide radical SAM maturase
MPKCNSKLDEIFALSRRAAGADIWKKILSTLDYDIEPAEFGSRLTGIADELPLPAFLPELTSLEWQKHRVAEDETVIAHVADDFELNPTLDLVESSWKLSGLFDGSIHENSIEAGPEIIVIWRDPLSRKVRLKNADKQDLLALKLTGEGIDIETAIQAGASFEMIADSLRQSIKHGMVIPSRSILRRDTSFYPKENPPHADLVYVNTFTLQWHITHACDLHCKHCYDRSKRSPLTLQQGESIIDDLRQFCREHYVNGHICFSGGNPLLYPQFFELYAAAAKQGFSTSILGNPTTRENLRRMIDIQKPDNFQVSLEGLEEHNDYIRGKGFYKKVFAFLDLLREMKIESAVMLTLTKDNMDQILPLAEELEGRADSFTFNRLCPVGEGADLSLPSKEAYADFLEAYVESAKQSRMIRYKDNLINIILERDNRKPFNGCTGHGCGAAFNFVAILPDGEVHACRKFPSPIGNLMQQKISEIYNSPAAKSYRRGTTACDNCRLRPMCGGCLAVLYGLGMDISKERDPYCFIDNDEM